MKFSEEHLLVIESALMAARDELAFDDDWHEELSEVLIEVRREIEKD